MNTAEKQEKEEESTLVCPQCTKLFANSYGLKRHVRDMHGGRWIRRQLKCPHCPKEVGSSYNLQRHIRIHTGEKRFGCPECTKRFMEKHHLEAHSRTHTGAKPYVCASCDYTAADLSNLLRHCRNLHDVDHRVKSSHKRKIYKDESDLSETDEEEEDDLSETKSAAGVSRARTNGNDDEWLPGLDDGLGPIATLTQPPRRNPPRGKRAHQQPALPEEQAPLLEKEEEQTVSSLDLLSVAAASMS